LIYAVILTTLGTELENKTNERRKITEVSQWIAYPKVNSLESKNV